MAAFAANTRAVTSSAPPNTASQNTSASSTWRQSGTHASAPRESSRASDHSMLYASQYRNCAHIRLERSCAVRGVPSAWFFVASASRDAAAGSASAAVAHPYRVRNVGVKKNTAHPIIGKLALSSAKPSAVPARLSPRKRSPYATPRRDLCALRSSTRRTRRIGKKKDADAPTREGSRGGARAGAAGAGARRRPSRDAARQPP